MRTEFDLVWSKLFSLIETKATFEAHVIINFLRNLDDQNKILLLTGGPIRERLDARGIITPNRYPFSFHAVARWSMNDAFSLHHDLSIDIFTSLTLLW